MTHAFDDADIDDLERILRGAKARLLSDVREAQRLYGAYGDRRDAIVARVEDGQRDLDVIDGLLAKAPSLREPRT
jgi:hypothetical protein